MLIIKGAIIYKGIHLLNIIQIIKHFFNNAVYRLEKEYNLLKGKYRFSD